MTFGEQPPAETDGVTPSNFDTVFRALVLGFHQAPLPTAGGVLTATETIFDTKALATQQLPALSFQEGSFTTSPWAPWLDVVNWTVPGDAVVATDYLRDGGAKVRQVLYDLHQRAQMLRGLPVDGAGAIIPYSEETAHRFDTGELSLLVTRSGPLLRTGRVLRLPGTQQAHISLSFTLEFYLSTDPRKVRYARVFALGMTPVDVAQKTVPPGWTPDAPPAASDVVAMGRLNTADPLGGDVRRVAPPFFSTGEADTPDDPAKTLHAIASSPPSLSLPANFGAAQLMVVGTFMDGSTYDLTGQALFTSTNTAVATVTSTGAVSAHAAGTATINLSVLGRTATCSVTVS